MAAADSSSSEAKVHIIYTEKPKGVGPKEYHIKSLTRVLGSEEAAKGALVCFHQQGNIGFSAKLTPEQVSELANQPDVLQIVPSQILSLH